MKGIKRYKEQSSGENLPGGNFPSTEGTRGLEVSSWIFFFNKILFEKL